MSKETGGQAFPVQLAVGPAGDVFQGYDGMSLRDYFAAKALAGDSATSGGWALGATDEQLENRAVLLYRVADAMLKARAA